MRKIDKPDFCIEDIFNKHNKHFKNKFNCNYDLIKKNLIEKENYYKNKCLEKNLARISECNSNNLYNSNEMISSYEYVYDSYSKYRNDIKKLVKGICPLCDSILGYRTLELDHILPKSRFCDYIITPINIVPICTSCNNSKQEKFGNIEEGILNPYFNQYELKKMLQFKIEIIDNDMKVKVDIIDEKTFIEKFLYKNKNLDYLSNAYIKIKHHILLHKINETLKNKAEVCLNTTIITIIKDIIKHYKVEENKFFKILETIKIGYEQVLINEEYIKNILIYEIINHEYRSNIYKIIINKIEKLPKEFNIDEDFDV